MSFPFKGLLLKGLLLIMLAGNAYTLLIQGLLLIQLAGIKLYMPFRKDLLLTV